MAGIRPFDAPDIPQVAALHQQVFGVAESPGIQNRYRMYFSDKFVDPFRRGGFPSLVFEGDNREICGFIGVATRSFSIGGRMVRAAVSSQFIVDPRARSRLVALRLLKDFLDGPQDLSFTDEANETSRILWERLGGSAAPLYSMHWIAPLHPANLLLSRTRQRLGTLAVFALPFADLIDGIVSRLSSLGTTGPRQGSPELRGEPLPADALAYFMSEPMDDVMLRPVYDAGCLDQMFQDATQPKPEGRLQGVLLRDSAGHVEGWYLYCLNRRGAAEVLQVRYRSRHRAEVIDHLFEHARRNGAAALAGRLEPHMPKALAAQLCLLYRREYLMLVHSQDPQIMNAIQSGKAFISRLDGEWCLRFH